MNRFPAIRRAFGLAVLAVACICKSQEGFTAEPASVEEQFVAGLRERQLFWLAARHCEAALRREQLAPQVEAVLAGEWIRALSEDASLSSGVERAAKWKQADDVAERWISDHPNHPRLLLVEMQWALNHLSRGELLRLEAELASDPIQAAEEARQVLREAVRRLEGVETRVVELQAATTRRPAAPPAWTADELASMRNHLRFQQARSTRNQGLSYPVGSPDRLAALTQATEFLLAVTRELPATESLGRSCRLELAIDRRLLGQPAEARELLREVGTDEAAPAVRLASLAESVRLELDAGQLDGALKALASGREIAGVVSPELDLAHVETFLALWHRAAERKDEAEGEKWRRQSLESVREIERVHGRYWGRRAEILLVRAGGQRGDASIEILRRAADDFFLKGDMDQAVLAYEKGSAAARLAGNADVAFELAFRAALVEQQRRQFEAAAKRFRALARELPADFRAPQAHFLAIANLAQRWKQDPATRITDAPWLEEHLAKWPQASSADDVRFWLAAIREEQRDWCHAIQAYQGVRPSSPRAPLAVQGAERCLNNILATAKTPAGCDLTPIRRWFEEGVLDGASTVAEWSEVSRWRLLAAARLRLGTAREVELPPLEEKLRGAMVAEPKPPTDWSHQAQDLLIRLLARQPGRETDLATSIAARNPAGDGSLALASFVADAGKAAALERKRQLAMAVLQLLKQVTAGPLSESDRHRAKRLEAQALFDSGDAKAGLSAMRQLAQVSPQDLETQLAWGTMLLASPDPADWKLAVDHWRRCVAKIPPRTSDWFRGKLAVSQSLIQSGDKGAAAKLIRYLQATENLKQAGFETQFADLLRQCESP